MTRTATCLLLLVGLFTLTATSERVFAQPPPPPWEWTEYKSGDDTYFHPQWGQVGAFKTLTIAQGHLKYPKTPAVTKVVMKVYREGSTKGSWEYTAAIDQPNAKFEWNVDKWLVTASPPPPNEAKFVPGSNVKFSWIITTQDGVNPPKMETVDVFTTADNKKK
jgi:hypothetical protein